MKIFFGILKTIAIILVIIITSFMLIFGIRTYNGIKYKSYKHDIGEALSPTDLSQYNTNIEGVEVSRITGEYMNGFRLKPLNKTYKGVIITFGGSEGSPSYHSAEAFARAGFETLALFFFGMENQKEELVQPWTILKKSSHILTKTSKITRL